LRFSKECALFNKGKYYLRKSEREGKTPMRLQPSHSQKRKGKGTSWTAMRGALLPICQRTSKRDREKALLKEKGEELGALGGGELNSGRKQGPTTALRVIMVPFITTEGKTKSFESRRVLFS